VAAYRAGLRRAQTALDLFPLTSLPLGRLDYLAALTFGGLPVPRWATIPRPRNGDLPLVGVPRGWVDGTDDERLATPRYARNRLVLDDTPKAVKDRVWRHLGERVRAEKGSERESWCLYALSVAFPGLIKRAMKLHPKGTSFDRSVDVEYDLLIEFIFAMHRLSLDEDNVYSRLLGAAYDQASGRTKRKNRARKRRRRPGESDQAYAERLNHVDEQEERESTREVNYDWVPEGEIETALERDRREPAPEPGELAEVHAVLDRLVQAASRLPVPDRLTADNAALIRRTYVDRVTLEVVAAELGLSLDNASKRRTRAVKQVARLLGHPWLANDDEL
jgi:hypothetical protein